MKKNILLILVIILLTGFLRLPYVYEKILNPDEATYAVVAREILNGKLIYRDIIDMKPPFGHILFMLGEIFNKGNSLFGIHLIGLFWVILTTIVLIKTGNYIYGNSKGYITGFLYTIFSMSYYSYDMVAVNLELLMVLPLSLSFLFFSYYLVKKNTNYLFLSALMTGLSFLFKQTGIYNFFPILLIYWFIIYKSKKFSLKEVINTSFLTISGFLLPFLISLIFFTLKG
ncbi:MAG: glycosyltransferase family 39 protein, partial [Candidatus Omnitrophica bacterium]|nr:glycosyltransferase family 39 protein [Candidatus Omnitrophota bacterium]